MATKRQLNIAFIRQAMKLMKELSRDELSPDKDIILHPVNKPLKHFQEIINTLNEESIEVINRYFGDKLLNLTTKA
jgi:hypothetical protein